jgi:hypothetical protein
MSQRTLQRFVTAGALAAILFIGAAVPAQARDLGTAGHAWGWLEELWTRSVSVLGIWTAAPAPARGPLKQGPGLDPNGVPTPTANFTGESTCGTCSDQGYELDPNG